MGYSYYFLLGVRSLPKGLPRDDDSLDEYFKSIVQYMRDSAQTEECMLVNEIGQLQYGAGSGGFQVGNRQHINAVMLSVSAKFPEVIFDLYHFYMDCRILCIVSYLNSIEVESTIYDHTELKIHTGTLSTVFPFDSTFIDCGITEYFCPDYERGFEYSEKILGPR